MSIHPRLLAMLAFVAVSWLAGSNPALALPDRIDLTGPAGFGEQVYLLPNNNIVVVNSFEDVTDTSTITDAGAVYLYRPDGTLISRFTGRLAGDRIGSGGILVLDNSHFVVLSPSWRTAALSNVGAVTWVNGWTGFNGYVEASNSLIGQADGSSVGQYGVALPGGRYLIASPEWRNGALARAGALTILSGAAMVTGFVTTSNSIVGTEANDQLGSERVFALPNGDAVAISPNWNQGRGAITQIRSNGNTAGNLSASNSLIGAAAGDGVGSSGRYALLSNGNYVVCSAAWVNSALGLAGAGAATFFNASNPRTGVLSPSNSLVGAFSGHRICSGGVTALRNGHYVVQSPEYSTETVTGVGALTWGHGTLGTVGTVSAANSLLGSSERDYVGAIVQALADGNYLAVTPGWTNAGMQRVGAVTWRDGSGPFPDMVALGNSLVGQTSGDQVGSGGVAALTDGSYVIASPNWSGVGAITKTIGGLATIGIVTSAGSIVGTVAEGSIAESVLALSSGHYVVASPYWKYPNSELPSFGAVTWLPGNIPAMGTFPAANSVIGATPFDALGIGRLGQRGLSALPDGGFLVYSAMVDYAGNADASALCRYNGTAAISGGPTETYCLFGQAPNASLIPWNWVYDDAASLLVVGRPSESRVSIIGRPNRLHRDGFE